MLPNNKITMKPSGEIISEIDNQIDYLMNIRAMFPYITDDMVGKTEFPTAPYYQSFGYFVSFKFEDHFRQRISKKLVELAFGLTRIL